MRKKINEDKSLSGVDKTRSEYRESKILYEDSETLIVEPKNRSGFLYFTTDPQLTYWNYDKQDYRYIFIVELNNLTNGYSPYMIRLSKYGIEILDKYGDDVSVDNLKQLFPQQKEILNSILPEYNLLYFLELVKKGDGSAVRELEDSDPLIYDVKFNSTSPKKTRIKIRFDDTDDFFKVFSDIDDQDLWGINAILDRGGYYDGPFMDGDRTWSDWNEGYLIREFNEENGRKLLEIISILNPNLVPNGDWQRDDDFCEAASKLLHDTYERQVESFLNEWTNLMNECMRREAEEDLDKTFGNIFTRFGIVQRYAYREYVTLVDVLLSLFEMYKPKTKTIAGLLDTMVQNKNLGGWGEALYDYGCNDNSVDESFQREVESSLDTIIEKLTEDMDQSRLSELQKLIQITKKYNIGQSYHLPKEKNTYFRIVKIDQDKMKLIVQYRKQDEKGYGETENRSFTPEEFNNFLYNLEIFE